MPTEGCGLGVVCIAYFELAIDILSLVSISIKAWTNSFALGRLSASCRTHLWTGKVRRGQNLQPREVDCAYLIATHFSYTPWSSGR